MIDVSHMAIKGYFSVEQNWTPSLVQLRLWQSMAIRLNRHLDKGLAVVAKTIPLVIFSSSHTSGTSPLIQKEHHPRAIQMLILTDRFAFISRRKLAVLLSVKVCAFGHYYCWRYVILYCRIWVHCKLVKPCSGICHKSCILFLV